MSDNGVLVYSVAVQKQLDEEKLAAAFEKLILYNEMLQVRLEDEKYVPQHEDDVGPGSKILFHYDLTNKSADEISGETEAIVKDLSSEMCCERRASLRAAVIKDSQNSYQLVFLVHRGIADPKSVVLLLEDIYRLYEQLSFGMPEALAPVRKPYTKFIEEVKTSAQTNGETSLFNLTSINCEEGDGEIQRSDSLTVTIDQSLKRRMFAWRLNEFELKAIEALVGAILRSLAKASEGADLSVDIRSDYRFIEDALDRTVCNLTHTYTLSPDILKDEELFSRVQPLRGILRELAVRSAAENSASNGRQPNTGSQAVLLNLEYTLDEPWLGGDEWMPKGFILGDDTGLSQNFSLEIKPVLFSDRIEVFFKYANVSEMTRLVQETAAHLKTELENILRYTKEYVEAKEFWVQDFTRETPKTNIEVESDERRMIKGRATMPLQVESSVVDRITTSLEADASTVLLAAYGALLSRLNGREDLVLVVTSDTREESTVFPLRLRPAWDSSFRQFVEDVKRKFEQAAATWQYAFDILGEEQPKHHRAYPVLDVGYAFTQKNAQQDGGGLSNDAAWGVELMLKVVERDAGLELEWVYERSRFQPELINSFGSHFKTILEAVSANPDINIGSIQISKHQDVHEVVQAFAQDAFNF